MLRGVSKMSIIKGLVIKDLLQLKSYKKTVIIYILIFCISSLSLENGIENMLVVMLTLGLGMFSIASFNYDEFNKVDRYILTLPVTKKEVVLSKYILVIVSTIVGSLIGIILSFAMIMLMNNSILNIEEILLTGLGGIFGVGIIEAIQIPCIYKFGAEKGRIQMVILTALLGVIIYFISKINIQVTNNIVLILNNFLPLILIVLIFIIYYISYRISYKIYSKKEL